jgi:hypothetical protein
MAPVQQDPIGGAGSTWQLATDTPAPRVSERGRRSVIRLKRIYNFLCSMLVFTPFAYCFVTLCGTFMHFPELTY